MKKIISPIVFTLIGFICCLFIPKCNRNDSEFKDFVIKEISNKEKKANESNRILSGKIKLIQEKNDSLLEIKPIIYGKYKKTHKNTVSLVKESNCDSISKEKITSSIDSLNNDHELIELLNTDIIINLNNIVSNKDSIISNDSLIISYNKEVLKVRENEIKQFKKDNRLKKIKNIVVLVSCSIMSAYGGYILHLK